VISPQAKLLKKIKHSLHDLRYKVDSIEAMLHDVPIERLEDFLFYLEAAWDVPGLTAGPIKRKKKRGHFIR